MFVVFSIIFVATLDTSYCLSAENDRNNCEFKQLKKWTIKCDIHRYCLSAENDRNNCEFKQLKKWTIKCDIHRKVCYDAQMLQYQQENHYKTTKRFMFKLENISIQENGRNIKNYSLGSNLTLQEFFKQTGAGTFLEDILWSKMLAGIESNNLSKKQIFSNKSTKCCCDQAKHNPIINKCPERSPYLVGKWPINKTTPNNMEEVVEKYPNVKNGSWKPTECRQERNRIAIVIPYRNRTAHLMTVLNNLHSLLQRQQANYRIFVADQAYPMDGTMDKFNRAKILNSAFEEIKKIWGKNDSTDCYIFHDVDLVPDYDTNIYRCGPGPIRLFATADEWNYWTDPNKDVVGSICAQTGEQFIKANGFPNIYWGWGNEDGDMRYRYKASNQEVEFMKRPIGDYTSLELINKPDDPTNPKIEDKCSKILREWRVDNWQTDGLNNLDYELREIEYLPLYTNISIDLLMAKSLQLKPHPCDDIFNN